MKNKSVKEILTKEDIKDAINLAGKEIHEWEEFLKKAKRKLKKISKKEQNEMPPTILDDDIADWEHDNLVKNG